MSMLQLSVALSNWSGAIAPLLLVLLFLAMAQVVLIVCARCPSCNPPGDQHDSHDSKIDTEQLGVDHGRILAVLAHPCKPLGTVMFSNDAAECPFECDTACGKVLLLHRPTFDKRHAESGNYPYGEHMHGRRRLWEFRWQVTFKGKVEGQVFFGLEQDKFVPVKWAKRFIANEVLRMLRRAPGGAMYQSYGDDPLVGKAEAERPTVVFPLALVDQLVITPAGQTPPSLSDPSFPSFGIIKSSDRKAFQRSIAELDLVPGPTYTFGFWSVSQFIDAIGWRVPAGNLLPEVRFRDIGISPPCYFVMYSLKPQGNHEKADGRHVDSRKAYSLRMAYWSTLVPPDPTRERELLLQHETAPTLRRKQAIRGRFCCF